ncbi:MAG: hypothetical protein V4724_34690 [Pseudomonadota bacterium]
MMEQQKNPTKEQIRQYMEQRRARQCPPPSIQEIRRQLGWDLESRPLASMEGR